MRLTENQKTIRDLAAGFASGKIEPRADEIEKAESFPQDLFDEMAKIGLIAIPFPEEYGGLNMGQEENVVAIEEISSASASAGTILAVTQLPLDAILLYGSKEQKETYLPAGLKGDFIGSFAFTEAETGSDPKQLTTVAKKTDEGKYLISGTKRFISNASYEGPMIIFAKEADTEECTAFIIDKFCKGYSLSNAWEKVGLQGSHIYDVFLDEVEVTEERVLGNHGQGFDILIGTTAYGKLAISAVFTGTMNGSYKQAVKYAKEKMHRGKPIAKFPTIQTKIAQISANTLSARLMLYDAAFEADNNKEDIRSVQYHTALLKGYVADLAIDTNVLSMNVLASYGVTSEYKVERFVRDSLIAPNIEGSADIQRLIAGNYILRN